MSISSTFRSVSPEFRNTWSLISLAGLFLGPLRHWSTDGVQMSVTVSAAVELGEALRNGGASCSTAAAEIFEVGRACGGAVVRAVILDAIKGRNAEKYLLPSRLGRGFLSDTSPPGPFI